MPRFDFQCAAGHVREAVVNRSTTEVPCCEQPARRLLAVPNLAGLGGQSLAPRSERALHVGEFQEAAAEVDHLLSKREYYEGPSVRRPNYFGMARERAIEQIGGGAE